MVRGGWPGYQVSCNCLKLEESRAQSLENDATRLRKSRDDYESWREQISESLAEFENEEKEAAEEAAQANSKSESGTSSDKPKISRQEAEKITIPAWPKINDLDVWKSQVVQAVVVASGVPIHRCQTWSSTQFDDPQCRRKCKGSIDETEAKSPSTRETFFIRHGKRNSCERAVSGYLSGLTVTAAQNQRTRTRKENRKRPTKGRKEDRRHLSCPNHQGRNTTRAGDRNRRVLARDRAEEGLAYPTTERRTEIPCAFHFGKGGCKKGKDCPFHKNPLS